jgi:hypothetical protein
MSFGRRMYFLLAIILCSDRTQICQPSLSNTSARSYSSMKVFQLSALLHRLLRPKVDRTHFAVMKLP